MPETINVAMELAEIRARIEARLSRTVPEIPELALPPLEPLRQARGVAEGWSAAMGGVNFRPPGMINNIIQAGKKIVARGLRWFTFPQSQFNSGAVAALVRVEEMFADVNRNMVVMGQNLVDRQRKEAELDRRMAVLGRSLAVIEETSTQRQAAEVVLRQRIEAAETNVQFMLALLRQQIDDVDARVTSLDAGVQSSLAEMSRSINVALDAMSRSENLALDAIRGDIVRVQQSVTAVQEGFWNDFARFQQKIDAEVRLVRQRLLALGAAIDAGESGGGLRQDGGAGAGTSAKPALAVQETAVGQQNAARHGITSGITSGTTPGITPGITSASFDYSHFEHRFRGPEESIRKRQALYLPILRDAAPVLDVACGRGEMLELLREQGIAARGVDLDRDMIERCKAKDLAVERADALAYLEAQAPESLGAIFSAQFIEHLPVAAYVRLIELAFSRLRPGGRLILETQNPECLAIFSQAFYLDPTHVRPVPAQQVRFLMEEAGFQHITIHYLSPAAEAGLPELPLLAHDTNRNAAEWNAAAERFNETYFRFMDYGIVGTK
jgi:2-polyprenyl-3-methyl-5-hydroxy-6-metoxy-1,4-benzoquinol methylase